MNFVWCLSSLIRILLSSCSKKPTTTKHTSVISNGDRWGRVQTFGAEHSAVYCHDPLQNVAISSSWRWLIYFISFEHCLLLFNKKEKNEQKAHVMERKGRHHTSSLWLTRIRFLCCKLSPPTFVAVLVPTRVAFICTNYVGVLPKSELMIITVMSRAKRLRGARACPVHAV
jgi:hypothetical protein